MVDRLILDGDGGTTPIAGPVNAQHDGFNVVGTAATETVQVQTGGLVTSFAADGDTVQFAGQSSDYDIQVSGFGLTVTDTTTGTTSTISLNNNISDGPSGIQFADGTLDAGIDTSGQDPAVSVGGSTFADGDAVDPANVNLDDTNTGIGRQGDGDGDGDGDFSLTESANAASEGESIEVTVTAESEVQSDQTLSVSRVPAGPSDDQTVAEPGDYSVSGGPLNFSQGDAAGTEQTFTINLRTDQEDEFDEEAGYAVRDASGNTVLEDTVIINDVPTGQTFSLTTNADNFTGTEAGDTFSGQAFSSLDSSDILDGAGGDDLLTARFDFGSASTFSETVTPTVSNIEDIRITPANIDENADEVTYDAGSTTGAEIIQATNLNGSTNDGELIVDNVDQSVALGVRGGDGDADVKGIFNDTGNADDAVDVEFSNAGQANQLQIDNVETVTVSASGDDNSLSALNASSAETLNIEGDGSFALSDPDTNLGSLKTVDASGNGGGVTLGDSTTTLNNNVTSFTGGAGDDTLHLTAGNVASDDSFEGGDGTDTVRYNGGSNANASVVSGFEALLINSANAHDLSDYSNSDIADVTVAGGVNATVSGLGGETVTFVNDTTHFTLNAPNSGASATVGLDNGTAESANGIDVGSSSLTTSNLETVTVESVDPTGAIDLDAGNANTIQSLDVKNVEVDASVATDVTTGGSTESVDASASSAGVTVDASSSSNAVTVTGGDGGDDVTVSGNDDTVNAGAGDDVVNSSGGNDTVNLGTGDDVYVADFGAGELDGSDVAGGDGTDQVSTTQISGTNNVDLTSSNAGALDALTNVEQFRMDVTANSTTNATATAANLPSLAIDDATSSAFGGFDAVVRDNDDGNDANALVDASGTVLNSSSVNLSTDFNDASGTNVVYKGGNAIEDISLSGNGDTVTYDTTSFLASGDSIDGGDDGGGTANALDLTDNEDTLQFTEDTSGDGAGTTTVSTDQLSNVSNVEQIDIALASSDTDDTFEMTLTDAFVSANADGDDEFELSGTNLGGSGAIDVDASGVSESNTLRLQGSSQADTLVGGAGDDTIDGGTGGDTLTGNGGNDTFVVDGTNTGDITDFDFGTDGSGSGDANVDQLDISGIGLAGADDVILQSEASGMPTDKVVVLDDNTFDQSGVDTALASVANDGMNTNKVAVIWQDGLGNVRYGTDDDVGNANGVGDITELGTLDNDAGDLDITGIANTVDAGDFVF